MLCKQCLQQALHSLSCCVRLPSQPCLEQESNATTHQLLAQSLDTLTKGNHCLSVFLCSTCGLVTNCRLVLAGSLGSQQQLTWPQAHASAGAIDALMLLDQHIAPGCVLLFDDLINYPDYRDHEIKALWEWLDSTGRKVEVSFVILPPELRNPASSTVGAQFSASLLSHLLMCHVRVSFGASGKLWSFTVLVKFSRLQLAWLLWL